MTLAILLTLDIRDKAATTFIDAELSPDLRSDEEVVAVVVGVVTHEPSTNGEAAPPARGAQLVAYSPWTIIDETHIEVLTCSTHPFPTNVEPHEALLHTASLIQANAIIHSLTPTSTDQDLPQPSPLSHAKRIVITGGETPLAAGLVQLLKHRYSNAKIYVTACMEDQLALFQRVLHLAQLGAHDAIDGAVPDLMQHWKTLDDGDGVDVIINTALTGSGGGEATEALPRRLVDQSMFVDCCTMQIRQFVSSQDIREVGSDQVAELHSFLARAADIFATRETPACTLADDED
ncbi:Putative NAD(P)-binding domain superfamily [Septoria linicola]|uniref:NAD(P)-binding domain superfamily n=1 Tax=Septoria linicola TaxID=215465 RepID=A0A9Q9END7_9PEZI|nr:putative NAD(P)-binding domain superfamily [Septoria linicola]USW56955.1 Putative NAD(P)-binding domain superfamily [Septoria linicola]